METKHQLRAERDRLQAALAYNTDPVPVATAERPHTIHFMSPDDERDSRVAILAIAFMLKNRADAMDIAEGSHVEVVLAQYDRVRRLRELLGPTTEDEHIAAIALWEETAA